MFDKRLIFVNKKFQDKLEAIDFLICAAKKAGKVIGGEEYKRSVLQREEEFSTAIGYDVAIPHGFSDNVKESFVAVATIKDGMRWQEENVRMIFLIGVPKNIRTTEHLKILAWLSKNLMHEDFRQAVMNACDEDMLFDCLHRLEKVE